MRFACVGLPRPDRHAVHADCTVFDKTLGGNIDVLVFQKPGT